MNRRQFLTTASAAAVSAAMPAQPPFPEIEGGHLLSDRPRFHQDFFEDLEWWPMPFSRASWLWANGIRPLRGAERNFYTRLAFSADYPQPKLERISYLARLLDLPLPPEEAAE